MPALLMGKSDGGFRGREAGDFYRKAADEATDPSGKRMLQYLADVEKGHEAMLRKEVEAFQRDAEWYQGGEGPTMVHVGS
ncbi:MAG: hypothetical protein JW821_11295 [Deltaproteobacteria bacterium]|nr:hypothetical protein [Deltaproteobacteria bacterium]